MKTDAEFWRAFVERSIGSSDFGHRAHVRAAYLVIKHHGFDHALPAMRSGLQELLEFARTQGYEPRTGYHETITMFWLRVVAHRMAQGEFADSNDFLDRSPELLDVRLMLRHYTKERLMSDEARRGFVEPDLAPMPDVATPPSKAS